MGEGRRHSNLQTGAPRRNSLYRRVTGCVVAFHEEAQDSDFLASERKRTGPQTASRWRQASCGPVSAEQAEAGLKAECPAIAGYQAESPKRRPVHSTTRTFERGALSVPSNNATP
jgi:hypothetical protein